MHRSDSTCKYLQPLHQKQVSGRPYVPVVSEPLKKQAITSGYEVGWFVKLVRKQFGGDTLVHLSESKHQRLTPWKGFFFFFFVIRARSICPGCAAALRLIVQPYPFNPPYVLDVPTFAVSCLHVHKTREIQAAKGGTCGREY